MKHLFIVGLLFIFGSINAQLIDIECGTWSQQQRTDAQNTNFDSLEDRTDNNIIDIATKQDAITITTIGTSGASTLIGATLNIPQYSTTGGGDMYLADSVDVFYSQSYLDSVNAELEEALNDTIYGVPLDDTLAGGSYYNQNQIDTAKSNLRAEISEISTSSDGSSYAQTLYGKIGTTANADPDSITHAALDTMDILFAVINDTIYNDSSGRYTHSDSVWSFTPPLANDDVFFAALMRTVTPLTLQDTTTVSEDILLAHYQFENTPNDTIGTYDGSLEQGYGDGVTFDNTITSFDNYYGDWNTSGNPRIDLPEIPFGNTFTVSCWVQLSTLDITHTVLDGIAVNDGFKLDWGIGAGSANDSIIFITSNGTTSDTLYSTQESWTYDNTYHLCVTVNNTTGEGLIYVNGVDVTGNGDILTDFDNSVATRLGINFSDGGDWASFMDELQIYNVVLTPTEVSTLASDITNTITR